MDLSIKPALFPTHKAFLSTKEIEALIPPSSSIAPLHKYAQNNQALLTLIRKILNVFRLKNLPTITPQIFTQEAPLPPNNPQKISKSSNKTIINKKIAAIIAFCLGIAKTIQGKFSRQTTEEDSCSEQVLASFDLYRDVFFYENDALSPLLLPESSKAIVEQILRPSSPWYAKLLPPQSPLLLTPSAPLLGVNTPSQTPTKIEEDAKTSLYFLHHRVQNGIQKNEAKQWQKHLSFLLKNNQLSPLTATALQKGAKILGRIKRESYYKNSGGAKKAFHHCIRNFLRK